MQEPLSSFNYTDTLTSLLHEANNEEVFCLLNGNRYSSKYHRLLAKGTQKSIESLSELKKQTGKGNQWLFGFVTYDLKNQLEYLHSENADRLYFPELYFFKPTHILHSDEVKTGVEDSYAAQTLPTSPHEKINIRSRISKQEYIEKINKIRKHIHRGDIYEMNFCMEFYAEDCVIDPISTYLKLNSLSPTPFSCLFKLHDKYIISASPERFLKKEENRVFSQPIKGTIRRGNTPEEDEQLKQQLRNDPKEQAENVMIVDLVRNDLSRSCKAGTVRVDELFGIYTFPQVHQMISTVSGELEDGISNIEPIMNAFPMGSMTGAPKVMAMELIEQYEETKRGVFSGSVGYFDDKGNFDFNVIIRTILYNATEKYLSFQVGSAITSYSDPEKEYEECLLKASAMQAALG